MAGLPRSLDGQPVGDVVWSGYLVKQGHWFPSWRKRLFLLTSRELLYCKGPASKTSKGRIGLGTITSVGHSRVHRNKPGIAIFTTAAHKDFLCFALDPADNQTWNGPSGAAAPAGVATSDPGAASPGTQRSSAAAAPTRKPGAPALSFHDLFALGKKLGEGAFSVVREAVHRPSGRKFAVKIMKRQDVDEEDLEGLLSEVATQRHMRHPHIVRLVAFFDNDPEAFYLVTELCTGGELFDRIIAKERYSEEEARGVVYTLLDAVQYCHRHGIVHRDLKPENILMSDSSPQASIKLADFGFAVAHKGDKLLSRCGTPGYLAPEIIRARPYDASVDMWSLGVVTYVLLAGYMPFEGDNDEELFADICSGQLEFPPEEFSTLSPEATDFIRRLLRVDNRSRMTAPEAIQHPWFQKSNAQLGTSLSSLQRLKRFHARRRIKMVRAALWVKLLFLKRMGGLEDLADRVEAATAADDEAAAAAGGKADDA